MEASVNFTPTVAVSNFPATQPVSGTVAVSNQPADPPTQTTLAAVLAKITANAATAALQSASEALLTTILDRLKAGLGGALSVDTAGTVASYEKATTLPITGVQATTGRCAVTQISGRNSTGAIFYLQVHDLVLGSLTTGDQPCWTSTTSVASGAIFSSATGGQVYGTPCLLGAVVVASSTQDTYTPIASTAIPHVITYLKAP